MDRYPQDANFLVLSARALVKLERFDEATARIEAALSIYPEFARPYEVRGDLLLAQGKPSAAAEAYQESLKLDPERQRGRMKLGQVLMLLGRVEEARALKAEFINFSQDNKDIAKAAELEKAEKYEEAKRLYREILIRHPDNVAAMRLWARLGMQQKQYASAEVLLQQAVEVAPGFKRAWTDLCQVQFDREKFDDTIESAKQLIKLQPGAADGYIWLAAASASAGPHEAALESFGTALDISPDHIGALSGKGQACRTMGDQEGAIAAFRRCLQVHPLHVESYWSLANLKTFRFEEQEVEDMLALLGDERIPQEGQAQLNNALGMEFEGREEYERAFEFCDRCNKLRREKEFFDRVENLERTSLSIEAFTQQFLEDNAGLSLRFLNEFARGRGSSKEGVFPRTPGATNRWQRIPTVRIYRKLAGGGKGVVSDARLAAMQGSIASLFGPLTGYALGGGARDPAKRRREQGKPWERVRLVIRQS